ncbi:hypothetical protein LTR10_004819 [Elasticomyces elasticus]|nr:hypothetical protein LTR10_004819 [Elasticomyces elasticus]KAK4977135.1 hypothetical protein LTR42_003182 [Elasticomyces elasticus]
MSKPVVDDADEGYHGRMEQAQRELGLDVEHEQGKVDTDSGYEPDSNDRRRSRVRIVHPPSTTEEDKPIPRGILKRPTKAFPDHPVSIREGVAPLKDTTPKGIPPGARWTKIDRRLVNPEALEEAKERFEERLDCVIVLRVLTKEEIQKLADRTSEMRGERDVEERRDLKVTKRRERQSARHEPDEYTDSSEDERAERKPKMLEELELPAHEAEPEPEYGDEDRVSSTELQKPHGADHEKLHVHYQRTDHVGERRRFSTGEDREKREEREEVHRLTEKFRRDEEFRQEKDKREYEAFLHKQKDKAEKEKARRSLIHENVDSENAYSYTDPATMYATTEPKWRAEGLRRSKSSEMRQSGLLDVPGEPSYGLRALQHTGRSIETLRAPDPPPSTRGSEGLDRPSSVLEWLPDTHGVRPEISLSTNAYCQADSDDEPSQSTPLGESALSEFRVCLGPTSDDESHPSTSASHMPDQTDLSEEPGNAILFAHLDPNRQDLIQDRLATRRSPEPTSPSQTSMDPGARVFSQPNERFRSGDDDDERDTCSTPTSVSSESNTAGGMSGWSSTNAISRIDGITTSAGTAPTTVEGNSSANKSGLPLSGEAQHDHDDLRSIQTDNRDIGATISRQDRKTFAIRFACELVDSLDLNELSDGTFTSLPDIILDFSRLLDRRAHDEVEHKASTFVRHHRENISRYARECLQFDLRRFRLKSGVYDFVSWIAGVSGDGDQPADRPSDTLDLPDLDFERIRDEDLPADVNQARQFLVVSEEFQWLLNRVKWTCRVMETGPQYGALRNQLLDLRDLAAPYLYVHIDWDPIQFIQMQYADAPGGTISTTITYNGTGDLLEAVGCEEYVHRMWPSYGGMVLDCVESAVRARAGIQRAEMQASSGVAKVTLELGLSTLGLLAMIEGNSVAKIEIMETLSWLGAACRVSPDPEQAMYCTPLLSNLNDGVWRMAFSTTSLDDLYWKPVPDAVDSSTCWSQLVRNPVIIKGYPIARRHDGEKGLEIEAGLLTTLADSTRAVLFEGALMLTGLCTMVVAVSEAKGSILWHYLLGDNSDPVCYNEARKYCKQAAFISFGALSSARHFVGWTDSATVLTGTADANYNVDFGGRPIRAGCALKDVTVGFSKIISMSTKLTPGLKDTRLTYSKPERYKFRVEQAEKMRVVFYDVKAKRAFLVNGADALLHLSRAYLSSPHAPPFDHNYSAQLVEEFTHRTLSKNDHQEARHILCKPRNRKIVISRVDDSDDGSNVGDAADTKEDPDEMRFEHLVTHFYEILREMYAHQAKIRQSEQWSVPIKNPFTVKLEGFGFADMMSLETSLEPRYAQLNVSRPSWLEVTDKAGAVNILGTGFGDLFSSSSNCNKCTIIPAGYDFLVSSTKILRTIAAFRMGIGERHFELAEGVFWNWPGRSCRPSSCGCATHSHGIQCHVMVTELEAYGAQPPQHKAWHQKSTDLPHHAAVIFGNPEHFKRARSAMASATASADCDSCMMHRGSIGSAVLPHQNPGDHFESSTSGGASTQSSITQESNASTPFSSHSAGSQGATHNASAEDDQSLAPSGNTQGAGPRRKQEPAVGHYGQARGGAMISVYKPSANDRNLVDENRSGKQRARRSDFGNPTAYDSTGSAGGRLHYPLTGYDANVSRIEAGFTVDTPRAFLPEEAQVFRRSSLGHSDLPRSDICWPKNDRIRADVALETTITMGNPANTSTEHSDTQIPGSSQGSAGTSNGNTFPPTTYQDIETQDVLSQQSQRSTDHLAAKSLADRTSLSTPRLRRKAGSVMRTGGTECEDPF